MQKLTFFFWMCSGSDINLLEKCPTETSKYTGIGATIFFTGLFAAVSGGYALYTIFDNLWYAIGFGILWGLLIFNLDRYIVSSMRKEGKVGRELLMATPRILLAILVSIVIAKPLELKIFEKEIQPELIVMEQQAYAKQEAQLKSRFIPSSDSLKAEIEILKTEVAVKTAKRDELLRIAQQEADGTGGSKRKNLGPIYKVKKADALAADSELSQLSTRNESRIQVLEKRVSKNDSTMLSELISLEKTKVNGLAARIEAIDRLTQQSSAIAWAHWFIILLFIALETAPVFVKLISSKGPYDNLLKIEEHTFSSRETEELARINAETKGRTSSLPVHERTFVQERLDAALKS
ncbi:MAG: DUF4407 domain-containing protein [Chryseolinea sp.]